MSKQVKRSMILLALAVMIALYLGVGALAFNSPVSPVSPIEPQFLTPLPTGQHGPIKQPMLPTTPVPTLTPVPIATPIPFVPISPIIFNSPLATPVSLICVAPGMYGQVLCYEVQGD